MRKIITVISVLLLLVACNKGSGVISKSKMKDVLYDYHIAQSVIEMKFPSDSTRARACMAEIFRKHDITEAQFDSSMVYYNRHPDELKDIYAWLKDKYTDLQKDLQAELGTNDMMVFTEGGDTADIWSGQKMFVLRPNVFQNKESFAISADTSFHHNDQYVLQTNIGFSRINKSTRDCILTLGLSIMYEDGKVVNETRSTSYDGQQRLELKAVLDSNIKKILGFFYYESTCSDRNMVLIEDVRLLRMHETQADSITTDTVITIKPEVTDTHDIEKSFDEPVFPTAEQRHHRHEMMKDSQHVEIRTMPAFRTPNKGPKRKLRKQ